jgi:protein-tyrosine phosphatase
MHKSDAPTSLLFVCMGNICRSPTAHGVMRHKARAEGWGTDMLQVDSAGTHNYHPGAPPDARSQQHAARRGYVFSDLRARQLRASDFATADLILVMDWDNLALVEAACPPYQQHKVRRLTEFCTRHDATVVPDPYYGGEAGFEEVLDLVEDACDGLLAHIARQRAQAR